MKKYGILCIAMLLVASIPLIMGAEEDGGDVALLVSDNLADSAVAESIANQYESLSIYYIEWGTYDQSVVDAILEQSPTQVIILGGPMAVVPEVEQALSGLDVIRIGGMDREETSLMAMQRFANRYQQQNRVVVANGAEESAIALALKSSLEAGTPMVFDDGMGLGEQRRAMLEDEGITAFGRAGKGQGHGQDESVDEQSLGQYAQQAITDAENALNSLAAGDGDNASTAFTVLHANAIRKLESAQTAYGEGNYGRAFGLAHAAQSMAQNALRKGPGENPTMGNLATKAEDWLETVTAMYDEAREEYESAEDPDEEIGALLDEAAAHIDTATTCFEEGDYQCTINELALAKADIQNAKRELGAGNGPGGSPGQGNGAPENPGNGNGQGNKP
jgi:putative cell wall-binding protein